MTNVHFSWKQLDGIVNPYMAASGVVTITPISYNREDKSLVTDASSAKRVSGEYDFNLPPNSNGTFYQFELNPNGGSTTIEYRFVPDNPSIDYVDLPLVDKNADFVTDPSVPPWIAELEALKESGDFFVTKVEESAEQARDAATLSQEAAHSVMPMLSGSVTITPEGGTLAVDLGQAVNVATGLDETSGAVDVTFPPVTTPDGRVNPDGLGTLLRVNTGAERLTWPGGTVVHGTPPEGQSALASLVRVGGSVTVVWPPDVVASVGAGVTAQIAEIEQIIGGEVEVQPGGTVMRDAWPGGGVDPAVFVNPYSRPTSSELVLSVGVINQALVAGTDFTSYATHRPGGLTDYYLQAYAALGPDSEPAKDQDGWLVAVHPGPAFTDARVTETMYDICVRVPTSRVVMFADGAWGVIFQYDAENPLFQVYMWEGYVMLTYKEDGSSVPWPNGVVPTSGLRLPMQASESEYTSLGITLPGTFHRAAEFEAMGVYPGD